MAGPDHGTEQKQGSILNPDQEAVLDLYIAHLDYFLEDLQEAEKLQVKIETLHLKRILGK